MGTFHAFNSTTTACPHPLPPIPSCDLSPTSNLIPRPLFTSGISFKYPQPPLILAAAVLEVQDWQPSHPSPSSTTSSSSCSPTKSAFAFDFSSTSVSPGPPPYSAISPSWSHPPPPYQFQCQGSFHSNPSSTSGPSSLFQTKPTSPQYLRRKPSPKQMSLRAIRAKESDACLQQIYERQTMAYLDGTVFGSAPRRCGLRKAVIQGD